MSLNQRALGVATPATATIVERERITALCDVVNDSNPAFREGWRDGPVLAPPTFINCFRDTKSQLLIDVLGVDMPKLLHGEQEMFFHHPIVAGDTVYQQVAIVEVGKKQTQAMGDTDFFKVRITLRDADANLLAEAYQSFFVRSETE